MAIALAMAILLLLAASSSPWLPVLHSSPLPPPCSSIALPGLQSLCLLLASLDSQGASAPPPPYANRSSTAAASCAYKAQHGSSLHLFSTPRTHHLSAALLKYSSMHRRCFSLDYHRLLHSYQGTGPDPACRYVVWSCSFGFGNRLMSLVSTFLYAILSQRVLLVDNPGWEELFCEPFEGSQWQTPPGFSVAHDTKAPSFREYSTLRCGRGGKSAKCHTKVVSVEFRTESISADHEFLVCPSAMARVASIPFLNFRNSNQHFEVGFYLNPAIRPLLEVLFPDRNPFHMLSRFLLNPSDAVWNQVSRLHEQYLEKAVQKVGVQIREFKGGYQDYYDTAVPLCLQSKPGMCPMDTPDDNSTKYVSVFVSSLAGEHVRKLKASTDSLQLETGQRYVLFSQESDGEQLDDIQHQQKALVDMWVLSLSDVLLTSHMSTFGYTAQGLAGITPYLLKPWRKDPCWRSVSSDPCFHFAPREVVCKSDAGLQIGDPAREFDFVSRCPDFPKTGLQLQLS